VFRRKGAPFSQRGRRFVEEEPVKRFYMAREIRGKFLGGKKVPKGRFGRCAL